MTTTTFAPGDRVTLRGDREYAGTVALITAEGMLLIYGNRPGPTPKRFWAAPHIMEKMQFLSLICDGPCCEGSRS
jgi:hypothetical protein